MKLFAPTIDIEKLKIADIIATSIVSCDADCGCGLSCAMD